MNQVKYQLNLYQLYDARSVERHLAEMAAKGWQLEQTGNHFWKYRRSAPAECTYAVTYAPTASDWNPGPTEEQQILTEYCTAGGWEKVTDWMQMQIFCTAQKQPVPLETDEALRLEVTRHAMKRSFLPGQWMNLAVLVLLAVLQFFTFRRNPIVYLSQGYSLMLGAFLLCLFLLSAVNIGSYFWWSKQSEQAVEQGGSCVEPHVYLIANKIGYAGLIAFVLAWLWLFSADQGRGALQYAVLYFASIYLIIFVLVQIRALLRRRGCSKTVNVIVVILLEIVLTVVLAGGLTYGILVGDWFHFAADTQDTVPVTVEDLQPVEAEYHEYHQQRHQSVLLDYLRSWQYEAEYCLRYELVTVKAPWLYDWCLQHYLQEGQTNKLPVQQSAYRMVENPTTSLDRVYQYYEDGYPYKKWLLCKENRMIKVIADWTLTAEQLQIIGDSLSLTINRW